MKPGEFRALSDKELLGRIDELQKGLFNLRLRAVTKELEDTSKIKATRIEIARVKTILRERGILI